MIDSIPFYFSKSTYHDNKKALDKVLDELGLEWDADKKVWSGKHGTIKGVFRGYKKPAVLHVDGDDTLISTFKNFADDVGAEIKDAEIEDIRETRKVEKAERDEKRKQDEAIRVKKEKDEAEAFESVIRHKLAQMENAELNPVFIRNWIKMELGVDISERLGIEKEVSEVLVIKKQSSLDASDDEKSEVVPGFISFVCRAGNHAACGGNHCDCECHKTGKST